MSSGTKRFLSGLIFTTMAAGVRAAPEDVDALLKLVPAEAPVTIVFTNLEKFDAAVTFFAKSLDPDSEFKGMLADIKKDFGVADWVDFSKPVAMVQTSIAGAEQNAMIASSPSFNEKVKALPDAKEEEGVWHLTFGDDKDELFAVAKGPHVIAATSRDALTQATNPGKPLADDLKSSRELLKTRDGLVHVNFESIRPTALNGIAQGAMMAPMIAMGLAGQGGVDPAAATSLITTAFEGVKKFVEQIGYIDIAFGMSAAAADVTIQASFNEGPIRGYLAKQKPAAGPFFSEIEDQPFFMAMGWNLPGSESPVFDFVLDKLKAAPAQPPPGSPAADPAAGEKSAQASADAWRIFQDMVRKIEGVDLVVSATKDGMSFHGNYLSADAKGLLDLFKKSLALPTPLAKTMGGGISYEPSGSNKVGEVLVEEYAMKADPANPAGAQWLSVMGEKSRMSFGVVGNRVHYHSGPPSEVSKAFAAKVEKPMSSAKSVNETVGALPAQRNALILIDLPAAIAMIGPMMGLPLPTTAEGTATGPAIGISATLAGYPARIDLHIPLKAIERLVRALSPQQPM